MRFFAAFVALVSSLVVVAAGDNRTASAFIRYKIVPDIITTPPLNQLYARFPSGAQVRLGNSLSPGKLQDKPTVTWGLPDDDDSYYTLMMVDPDAPSPSDPSARSWVHWLVINIPGDKISQGVRMAGYDGPTPPPGTGLHRYVLLAFSQEAQIGSPKFTGISGFNVEDFIKNNNLHPTPVAGNFFRAQDDGTV